MPYQDQHNSQGGAGFHHPLGMNKVPSKLSGIQINNAQQNTGAAAAVVALPNSI
jgi:hypothetical protein